MISRRPTPWAVTGSRIIHRDRWISLRADDCLSDEGVEFAPWYVIEQADWVQVVAVTDAHEVVLIEQYRHGRGIISLELPTGVLDHPGEAPLDAGRRELAEETGYTARNWRLLASIPVNPANHNNLTHIVLATGAAPTGTPADDPHERIRAQLRPAAEVVALARSGGVTQAMHVTGLALGLTELGLWG
jgi:8-oxo-dGTP pyrophosphatase MutT (NUDIX family)